MAPGDAGPLKPPGAGGSPEPEGPGAGGGFPSPSPAQGDNSNSMDLSLVHTIVSAARRLGVKYPAALEEVRAINNAVARLQQKILKSHPAPEPMAPPV